MTNSSSGIEMRALLRAAEHSTRSRLVQIFNAADSLHDQQISVNRRGLLHTEIQEQSEAAMQAMDKLFNMLRLEEEPETALMGKIPSAIIRDAVRSIDVTRTNRTIQVSCPDNLPKVEFAPAVTLAVQQLVLLLIAAQADPLWVVVQQIADALEFSIEVSTEPEEGRPISVAALLKHDAEAIGLDLFICQRLVRLSKGSLHCFVNPKGALVCVKLTIPKFLP